MWCMDDCIEDAVHWDFFAVDLMCSEVQMWQVESNVGKGKGTGKLTERTGWTDKSVSMRKV